LKADAAGEVGVSGGVDAKHLADFSSASGSPLNVRFKGRHDMTSPEDTSSRGVTRRSTAPLLLPVSTSIDASISATIVYRVLIASVLFIGVCL